MVVVYIMGEVIECMEVIFFRMVINVFNLIEVDVVNGIFVFIMVYKVKYCIVNIFNSRKF